MELLRLAFRKAGAARPARPRDRSPSEDHLCGSPRGGAPGRPGLRERTARSQSESSRRYRCTLRRAWPPAVHGAGLLPQICRPHSLRYGSDSRSLDVPLALPVSRNTRRVLRVSLTRFPPGPLEHLRFVFAGPGAPQGLSGKRTSPVAFSLTDSSSAGSARPPAVRKTRLSRAGKSNRIWASARARG